MLRAWLIGEVILFVSLRAKVSHEKSLFNACSQKEKVPYSEVKKMCYNNVRGGVMSKYTLIYRDLLDMMRSGEIAAYSYLPSENELMKIYGASRDTIRKALNLLLQDGYIQKQKGKGSLVLEQNKIAFPVSGLTSFKELAGTMHASVQTDVHCFEKIVADTHLKQELYMDQGEVYHIERIREIDGEKVILDTDYINAKIIPGLTEEIAGDSIYEYIEKVLKLKVSFARKEITIHPASSHERQLLDMADHDLLVCVKTYAYLDDATLFQYTESKHRPDKFRFVEFARRSPI